MSDVSRTKDHVHKHNIPGNFGRLLCECGHVAGAIEPPAPPTSKPLALGLDTPWPLHDVVTQLIKAAEHLLDDHGCDAHGHELYRAAVLHGKVYLRELHAPETSKRPPHWTCKTHGDFDALRAVGCPECMRGAREALRRILGRAGGDWETLDGDDAVEMATIARDALDGSPVETSERRETGWLVEDGSGRRYRTMDNVGFHWTDDANKAIRFARRADAEMFASGDDDAWRVVEHQWIAIDGELHAVKASAPLGVSRLDYVKLGIPRVELPDDDPPPEKTTERPCGCKNGQFCALCY